MRTKAPNHQRSIVFSEAMFLAASGLPGDFNGDSAVDRADCVVWRAHFGQAAGSGAAANTNPNVPEPATWVLLTFAAGWCLERSRAV